MASMIEYLMYSAQNIVGMFLLYVPWMLIPFSICIILYNIISVQHSYFVTTQVFDSSPPAAARVIFGCGLGRLRLPSPQPKTLANHRRW